VLGADPTAQMSGLVRASNDSPTPGQVVSHARCPARGRTRATDPGPPAHPPARDQLFAAPAPRARFPEPYLPMEWSRSGPTPRWV